MKINDNWDNIPRLTKITLTQDLQTMTFNNKQITLKPRTYYISGFWANVMGLSDTFNDAQILKNKWVIPSEHLKHFEV